LERPVVIVFGFSAEYFAYYARSHPTTSCPNALYVAATRASERLYLVAEAEENGHLPFLRCRPEALDAFGAPLPSYLDVRRCGRMRPEKTAAPTPSSRFAATDLVKFLPESTIATVTAMLRATEVSPPTKDARIDGTVPSLAGKGLIESVSDVTGLAVVAAHEHRHFSAAKAKNGTRGAAWASSRSTALARRLESSFEKLTRQTKASAARGALRKGDQTDDASIAVDDSRAISHIRDVLARDPETTSDFLKLAAWYEAVEGGYLFRPFQLSTFDWVTPAAAAICAGVLETHLPCAAAGAADDDDDASPRVRYEKRYDVSFKFGAPIVTIVGAADAVTAGADPTIFEVKCAKRLMPEHLLQLATYQWLDAFGVVQRRVADARERAAEEKATTTTTTTTTTTREKKNGAKGFGRNAREYTDEEAEDAVSIIDAFERFGGDADAVMKRAVLLNARTGEALALNADLRTLTGVVAALVEHRTRAEKDLDDEAFLCAAADIGAKTHAPVAALVPEMVRPDDAGGASETWTDKKTRKATAAATEDGPRPVGRGRVKVKRKTAATAAATVDVPSLKVTQLKAELKARGASTAGNKAALAARLRSVIESKR
jgi:hypothetical protein